MHARGFTAGQKTKENQDWATGPPGHRAVAGRGPRATGPSWAVGRGPWAAGPLGRRGPWAAGHWAAGLCLANSGLKTLKGNGLIE